MRSSYAVFLKRHIPRSGGLDASSLPPPRRALLGLVLLSVPAPGKAASPAGAAASDAWLDSTSARWNDVSARIWGFSETALQETKSAALLADVLEKEGFSVTRGVAGMPTAFAASAGTGAPVIGILAEYDALPGLSQAAGAPKKAPRAEGAPGHGCGHNLLGTAAVAAAVAANRTRVAAKLPGTIRVFGTPAEEQLLGKPFMLRDGVFAGTDVVLAWHPADENYVSTKPYLAIAAVDVEFFGKTAHAAANPWLGRSALDALGFFALMPSPSCGARSPPRHASIARSRTAASLRTSFRITRGSSGSSATRTASA